MKIVYPAALVLCALAIPALAQLEGGADRIPTRGPGPGGVQQATFFVHRLGTDHAEGITTLDMNGDGLADLLSGAYWYENPGPQGGEWKRHQYRTQGTLNEFANDCGEWTVDVNHDGAPDVVTAGWMQNGVWWYENPKKLGAEWKRHFITNSYDTGWELHRSISQEIRARNPIGARQAVRRLMKQTLSDSRKALKDFSRD